MSEPSTADASLDRPRSRFAFLLRPWFLIVVTFLAILVAIPLGYRTSRLSAIPPIEEIVDRETEGRIEIKPDENAFSFYERAWKMAPAGRNEFGPAMRELEAGGWDAVPPKTRRSLDRCDGMLDEWKRGTELKLAVRGLPADVDWNTQGNHYKIGTHAWAAVLRSARCQHEGRLDEAWQWLHALFRFSRHLGNPGLIADRYLAIELHALACQRLVVWAAHSEVTAEQLATALRELRALYRNTVANSICLRMEYVSNVNSLLKPELVEELFVQLLIPEDVPTQLHGAWIFVNAEPQVASILLRHVFANYLSQCDLPRWERTSAGTSAALFLPTGTETPPLIDPRTLDALLKRSPVAEMFGSDFSLIEESDDEQALQSALELCLSVELFRRRHGRYPETLEALVPEFVDEVPRDVFGPTSADRMLMIRREDAPPVKSGAGHPEELPDAAPSLVIYSRGSDGIDDTGQISYGGDIGLRIPLPRSENKSE
jgi:hypothetical protein